MFLFGMWEMLVNDKSHVSQVAWSMCGNSLILARFASMIFFLPSSRSSEMLVFIRS